MNDYFGHPSSSSDKDKVIADALAAENINDRAQNIFRRIVDQYLETGSPVGSKSIAAGLGGALSSASIRSIMADLEKAGLLFQPHTSSGRLPTEIGLRLFVNGLMEMGGDLPQDTRSRIDAECTANGISFNDALEQASSALSGLSQCASLVISPKSDAVIRHVEFVPLGQTHLGQSRALVVIVTGAGQVENRIITLPSGLPSSALVEAGNFLSTVLSGSTLAEAGQKLKEEISIRRAEIDTLAHKVVDSGLAIFSGDQSKPGSLILRGHGHLLGDVSATEDLENIKRLFDLLETRENTMNVLDAVQQGSGVQIFIGADNALFQNTDCAMIIAPYKDQANHIVGAVGVIGPRRMNYARIIPMVDYTSEAIGKMLGGLS